MRPTLSSGLKTKYRLTLSLRQLIAMALVEDIGSGDITTLALGSEYSKLGRGEVIVKEKQIMVCGSSVADLLFNKKSNDKNSKSSQNKNTKIIYHRQDGEKAIRGEVILTVIAPIGDILSKERILLNFLQHLSGTATQSQKWATCLRETLGDKVRLLDTRKTLPGYRFLEKYAILCGGGSNHRMGLYDNYLIKDNHIDIIQGSVSTLKKVLEHRSYHFKKNSKAKPWVEIECRDLPEVREIVAFNRNNHQGADIIMLDNFSINKLRTALKIINKSCQVEISGNMNLTKIKKLAPLKNLGINYISAGALTHSTSAIDLSMRIQYA